MKKAYWISLLFMGVWGLSAPAQSQHVANLPFEGFFGINANPLTGEEFIYFEGLFFKPVAGVTIQADNPGAGQRQVLAQGANCPAGQTITISQYTSPWTWMPGETLTITAPGLQPYQVGIPKKDTPEWNAFVQQARTNNAQHMQIKQQWQQRLAPNLPPPSQQYNPWGNGTMPQQQWQQQFPSGGGSTSDRPCSHCNGKGTVETRKSAPYYGGDDSESRYYTLDVPCPQCGGTGKR